jgi:hypothetical protein
MVLAPTIPCPHCRVLFFTPAGLDAHLVNHTQSGRTSGSPSTGDLPPCHLSNKRGA